MADENETPSAGEKSSAGETRGRVASPPRPSAPAVRFAVRVWESKWVRELTVDEATVHPELGGSEVRTLMKIGEEEVYPPAALSDCPDDVVVHHVQSHPTFVNVCEAFGTFCHNRTKLHFRI